MKIQRTIPILIEADADLLATVKEFNRLQNVLSSICFNNGKPLRALELHKATYHGISSNLNSQMKCSAIRLTAAAYFSAKSNGKPATKVFLFKRQSALFLIEKKGRDASFQKGLLSISTIAGRKKLSFHIPSRFQQDFDSAVSRDALRVQGNGKATLCITLEVPDPRSITPVGIDLGVNNALVASTDKKTLFVSGKALSIRNTKSRKVRSRLQSKLAGKKAQHQDARSVVRVLKRLSRKHHNRNRTFCQETAAQLCKWAPVDSVLVFEDLHFKPKTKKEHIRKGTRRKLNGWFFNLMTTAVRNRAERQGLSLAYMNPAFTSQLHYRCGLLGVRKGHKFFCPHCNQVEHADVNASQNLRLKFTVLRSSGLSSTSPEALPSGKGKLSLSGDGR